MVFPCRVLLIMALIPSWGPSLMTSCNPNHLPKAPPPNTIRVGARASTGILGEHKYSSHNRYCNVFRLISLKLISSRIMDCIKIVPFSFESLLIKGKKNPESHLSKPNQTELKRPHDTLQSCIHTSGRQRKGKTETSGEAVAQVSPETRKVPEACQPPA